MAGRKWTEEEIQFLEESAGVYTVAVIGRKLGRSYDSVNQKLLRLGLQGFLKSTDLLTMNQICKMLGVESRTVQVVWHNKGLKIMRKGVYVVCRQEDLIRFLKEHPEAWNASQVQDDSLLMGYDWYKEKRRNDRPRRYFWTPQEVQKMDYLLRKGVPIPEIAKKLGRSESGVIDKLYRRRKNKNDITGNDS